MEPSEVLRFSTLDFRTVLGHFPTGVVVITATSPEGQPVGMAVGSFTSVSLDPPLVAFLPAKSSSSFPRIREAGTFCVNVLAADQEHICRSFAQRGGNKFERITYTPSPEGSPIIDGAVAWIDCVTESVVDAGDHYICIGRVRDLAVSRSTAPLVFFQGGYGQFATSSLSAPADEDLISVLRTADVARPEMERLASTLGSECLVSTVVGHEVVILASAGTPADGGGTTRVGHRIPFAPPIGSVLAAWDEQVAESWLSGLGPLSSEQVDHYRALLTAVRERGWAAGKGTTTQRELDQALYALPFDAPTSEHLEAIRNSVGRLSSEYPDVVELSAETPTELSNISAPVFDARGRVILQLSLAGLPPLTLEAARPYIDAVVSAARTVTAALGAQAGGD
jgi:flavin reductase (DIM6/NTAB) family NADH-FMN oxidoreductase RutF/DNA-binding IclR family transcriptional regulator